MVSHCYFNLHFPDDIQCGASFCMSVCHLYICFGEVSVEIFCLFLNCVVYFLLLSFRNSLYILDPTPLSDMCFT